MTGWHSNRINIINYPIYYLQFAKENHTTTPAKPHQPNFPPLEKMFERSQQQTTSTEKIHYSYFYVNRDAEKARNGTHPYVSDRWKQLTRNERTGRPLWGRRSRIWGWDELLYAKIQPLLWLLPPTLLLLKVNLLPRNAINIDSNKI